MGNALNINQDVMPILDINMSFELTEPRFLNKYIYIFLMD